MDDVAVMMVDVRGPHPSWNDLIERQSRCQALATGGVTAFFPRSWNGRGWFGEGPAVGGGRCGAGVGSASAVWMQGTRCEVLLQDAEAARRADDSECEEERTYTTNTRGERVNTQFWAGRKRGCPHQTPTLEEVLLRAVYYCGSGRDGEEASGGRRMAMWDLRGRADSGGELTTGMVCEQRSRGHRSRARCEYCHWRNDASTVPSFEDACIDA